MKFESIQSVTMERLVMLTGLSAKHFTFVLSQRLMLNRIGGEYPSLKNAGLNLNVKVKFY